MKNKILIYSLSGVLVLSLVTSLLVFSGAKLKQNEEEFSSENTYSDESEKKVDQKQLYLESSSDNQATLHSENINSVTNVDNVNNSEDEKVTDVKTAEKVESQVKVKEQTTAKDSTPTEVKKSETKKENTTVSTPSATVETKDSVTEPTPTPTPAPQPVPQPTPEPAPAPQPTPEPEYNPLNDPHYWDAMLEEMAQKANEIAAHDREIFGIEKK